MEPKITVGPCTAQVIEDSVSTADIRLTTLQLRYPRMIHAEFMTHRVFSRNARSSRAVPMSRLSAEDIYVPQFAHNQSGMQAAKPLSEEWQAEAAREWILHAQSAARLAYLLGGKDGYNIHKQWVNRLLEPFGYIDVLVTSTEWSNFFALRLDGAAQPEMQMLAQAMKQALDNSLPKVLHPGEWHLPYIRREDWNAYPQDLIEGGDGYSYDQALEALQKISVARCARLSYEPFDGSQSWNHQKEIERYDKLMGSNPKHASPAEHQATPDEEFVNAEGWVHQYEHGNFYGWRQFRKMIPGESQ